MCGLYVQMLRRDDIYLACYPCSAEAYVSNLTTSVWPMRTEVLMDIALHLGSISTTETTHSVQIKCQFSSVLSHWDEAAVNYARL